MPPVIDVWLHAAATACLIAAVVTVTLWIIGPRGPSNRARMYRAIWALAALASIPASAVATFAFPPDVSTLIACAVATSATCFYSALTLATAAQSAHPRQSFVAAAVMLVFAVAVSLTGALT